MGCVSSKQAVSVTPAVDHSGAIDSGRQRVGSEIGKPSSRKKNGKLSELGEYGRASSNCESLSFRLRNLSKYIEGEQVAAGWPGWLTAVAGEAIQGWVPLKADAFEKLEKIGQGTYSCVFRARELETGRIVALKKVRFDNFEPESVRFMAREILILRRLDHPNIMKLDGLITSHLSCSIYLVFEYMEHDITGLLSCPNTKFTEPQIKCYMKQLLSGIDHCHSKGIMHRDIKGSNLLVNDDGILKVADFGLANFCPSGHRQPLTSRVVTLWYRPPELLLGSTDYGKSVDLWSIGCVFAELLLGKPVLQGRTEVEQLHKIFKLCGSPPDEYWKKSKLPHSTLFKPQQPYDSSLHDTLRDVPKPAFNLIKTLLSVEPYKRGTAATALASEYFTTKPIACEPSSLPNYPPSKEIDAKNCEEAMRKKTSGRNQGAETRKPTRKTGGHPRLVLKPKAAAQVQGTKTEASKNVRIPKGEARVASLDKLEDIFHVKNASFQGDIPFSGPLQLSSSSGFAWAKRRKDDVSIRSHARSISRGLSNNGLELREKTDSDSVSNLKQWSQLERPDSFDASEYHSQELSLAVYQKEEMELKRNNHGEMVDFSGPLLCQTHTVDELLQRHERHIRQAVRMSWFQRGKKHGR